MSINAAKAVLQHGKTALLICDVQEAFAKVIHEFDKIAYNSKKLIEACKILKVPMIATEQNPKGLGKTISLFDICDVKGPFEKTQFSMYIPEVCNELATLCNGPPKSIILLGIETHVCVENTAIDLRQNGFEVHTVADCCSSRTQEDRLLALERMRQIGCHIATSENVILKLVGDAKHENFKQILKLIKTQSQSTGLAQT